MQTRILAYCASSMTHPKYFSLEKFWPLDDKDRKNGEVPTMEEALALQQRFIDEGILSPTKRN